MVPVCKMKVK